MAWLRLAARFGVPVDRAAEMISGRDFAEWMAAERSGVLELGAWQRMARICTTVGAAAGTTGLREEQFMPRPGAPAEQSEAHMKAVVSSVFGPPQPAKKEA